jgi:hypothetical protein
LAAAAAATAAACPHPGLDPLQEQQQSCRPRPAWRHC